ncbi:MAG: RHS repeat-associated core domain-containing protein [Candidatus Brocadiia bacterium]
MSAGTARETAEQKLSCQCRAESALCGRFSSLCPSHFSLRTSPFVRNQENLKDSTESELYAYDAPRSARAVYRLDDPPNNRRVSFDRGQLNANKDDANRRAVRWQFGRRQTAVSKGRKPRRGGNWDQTVLDGTTESRTHNDVNELTQRTIGQDPSISLSYDDAGNLIQDGDSDGDHKYTWDYRNRLIEVEEKQSGTWNTVAEYKDDGKTRRILKVVTNKGDLNGTTRFVWGGKSDWQCLEERDGSGDLVARFTYAPGYIDAPARQERDLNSDGDFGDDDEVVWYHSSTLYSVYALTDGSENVVERYRYDAYGACTVLDADFSSDADNASDVKNPYAFTGRRVDAESGLMQYRHRYDASELGRFVSRDPLEYVGGPHLYLYLCARPTAAADPLGLHATGRTWHNYLHEIGWFDETHGGETEPYQGSAYEHLFENDPNRPLAAAFMDHASWTTLSPSAKTAIRGYLECCDKGDGHTVFLTANGELGGAVAGGYRGQVGVEAHVLCDTREVCLFGYAGGGANLGYGTFGGVNAGAGAASGINDASDYEGWFVDWSGSVGGSAGIAGQLSGSYSHTADGSVSAWSATAGVGGSILPGPSVTFAPANMQYYKRLGCLTVPE